MARVDVHECAVFDVNTINWTIKVRVEATLSRKIRKILPQGQHGYTPDKQEKAVQKVIEQARLLGEEIV